MNYDGLPQPALPNANPVITGTGPLDAAAARAAQGGVDLTVIWAILMTCLVAGAIGNAQVVEMQKRLAAVGGQPLTRE